MTTRSADRYVAAAFQVRTMQYAVSTAQRPRPTRPSLPCSMPLRWLLYLVALAVCVYGEAQRSPVLVLGSGGFLGQRLVARLQARGTRIVEACCPGAVAAASSTTHQPHGAQTLHTEQALRALVAAGRSPPPRGSAKCQPAGGVRALSRPILIRVLLGLRGWRRQIPRASVVAGRHPAAQPSDARGGVSVGGP